MARTLNILSGGAAQGLVARLQPDFEATHGCRIAGSFGAVGLMKEKLLAGDPCDLLVVTNAMLRGLADDGRVVPATIRPLGVVRTGVAVKEGAAAVRVKTPDDLQATLRNAGAIYFPDPEKATAGIHFMKVLQALGLWEAPSHRLRTFPNGAAAMAALAQAPEADAVGCTQVTEILNTAGVTLTGILPEPHGLATVYSAAVCTGAAEPALAAELLAALAGAEAAGARRECGFE